jgi:hypothetical protein
VMPSIGAFTILSVIILIKTSLQVGSDLRTLHDRSGFAFW